MHSDGKWGCLLVLWARKILNQRQPRYSDIISWTSKPPDWTKTHPKQQNTTLTGLKATTTRSEGVKGWSLNRVDGLVVLQNCATFVVYPSPTTVVLPFPPPNHQKKFIYIQCRM